MSQSQSQAKVLVMTSAYNTDPSTWRVIRESARANKMDLHVIGVGRPFPQLGTYRDMIEYAQSQPQSQYNYILLTDGYDVMVNRWDEQELVGLIDRQPGKLLVSCNDECWPAGPWDASYPDYGTPWRTACGGQYAGSRDAVIGLWQEFLSGKWPVEAGGGNQEMLHRMWAAGYEMGLDRECQVFQIMGHGSQPYVGCNGKTKVVNIQTLTVPMFLHWGGRAPGMEETFGEVYGNQD